MELTAEVKALFIETAQTLKGHERRIFMAKVVRLLGPGGQRQTASYTLSKRSIEVLQQPRLP